jgi:hypothetical protein
MQHTMSGSYDANAVMPVQFKTNIAKEQQEIVERCLEFGEALKVEPSLSGKTDKLQKLAQGLEFSESTIGKLAQDLEFSESTIGNIQLASTDVTTPFVGNWTAGTLNMLIQEVGSSLEKDTLLSMAFPDKAIPMYKVILDRIVGNTGIAPEFGGNNSTLPTIRPLDTYVLEYQPGLWGGRISLSAQDIMFARKRGNVTLDDRGIGQLVAYNTVNGVTQVMTRKKYLLNQAIFNNGFSYNGATINSNIPSGNYVAMYESMGTLNADGSVTYSSSDPYYTPFIAITNILNNPIFLKYRRYIRGIVCNGADLQAMMNHPNVKAVTNLMMAAGTSLGSKKLSVQVGDMVKELNAYYAPSFEFPLLADDDVWVQQNADGTTKTTPNNATNATSAQQFFVPRGKMYVMLDLTSMGGQNGAFHLTYNQIDPNQDAPAMGLFTGVFNRNLNNSDQVNRIDIAVALSGAPAIYMPESQFILTGLFSNV